VTLQFAIDTVRWIALAGVLGMVVQSLAWEPNLRRFERAAFCLVSCIALLDTF
jgi:uncharacterized membrane protein